MISMRRRGRDRARRTAIVTLTGLLMGAVAFGASGSTSGGTAAPATLGPLVSATSGYVGGAFVATDYAYDDRGPNTDPRAGGDAKYPSGVGRGNAADLIQVQLAPAGADLGVRAVLESLTDPALPLVGIGFDSDMNQATGATSVP